MTSVVEICNIALSNVGKANIQSLEEMSAEAAACRQFYTITRDLLLQGYPWRFAGKQVSMAEVENTRPGQWGWAYQRPSDCLKIRWVRPGYSEVPYIEMQCLASVPYDADGSAIYCNLSPAILHYTAKIDDPSLFPPLFTDALGWHLAVRLSMPLTRDPRVRADAWQVATQMTSEARVADANEVRENSDSVSTFAQSRGGGAGGYSSSPAPHNPSNVWNDSATWSD